MSCNNWESGTLLLPTSAVTPLKRALRNKQNGMHEAAYQDARAWLRKNGAKYRRAIKKSEASESRNHYVSLSAIDESIDSLSENVYYTISAGRGKMPTRAQVEPKKATAKTNLFSTDEASISFTGREVRYNSGNNNRQVERARELPLVQVFFRELSRINWTRGSGGVLIGNDEYNQDSDYAGGGANYITAHYGPRGCQEYKREHGLPCEHKRPQPPQAFSSSYDYGSRRW